MIRPATKADEGQLSAWALRDFDEACDFTGFFANPLNVCLICGNGAGFFVWHGPGVFDVHIGLEERGMDAVRACHAMFDVMRRVYGAKLFWAAVPHDETPKSRKVRLFARLVGWKSLGLADLPHARCELFTGE